MLDYTKITQEITTMNCKGTQEELLEAINNEEEIINFNGGFEVDDDIVDSIAYEKVTEEGETVEKTWAEYARIYNSVDEGKKLIKAGVFDNNKNQIAYISSTELYEWINMLNVENILTKSALNDKKEIVEQKEEE